MWETASYIVTIIVTISTFGYKIVTRITSVADDIKTIKRRQHIERKERMSLHRRVVRLEQKETRVFGFAYNASDKQIESEGVIRAGKSICESDDIA